MKINLKLVKSSLDSIREDYTAIVVANGKTTQEDLITAVNKAEPHISKISAEQVLATELAFIGAMLAEGNYINMGGIGLMPMVEGSLLHADEDVTSDKLGIQVNVYDSEYLEAIKSLEVTTTIDEDSLPFNFTKVEDSATNDFGTVTPGEEFMPIGDKLSQGLEGERIEITDKTGTTKVINDATGSSNGMWLKATCPDGLVAGKGKIAVYSRGLKTPEGAIDHISRNITIREVIDKSPALTSFVQLNAAGVVEAVGKMLTIYDMIEVKGKNLPEGIKGRYALYDKDSGELKTATEWEANPSHTMFERVSGTTVRAQFKVNATPYPDGMWLDEGHPIKYEVKLPDESIISIALPLV